MQSKQVYYISQLVRARAVSVRVHCEMRHWYVIMWITAIWMVGFLLLLPLIIIADTDETGGCKENWELH